jgi:hypothetical protein
LEAETARIDRRARVDRSRRKRMPRRIGSVAPLFATLLLASAVPFLTSHPARGAEECLAAPRVGTPPGRHWYYRVDRAKGRKCWYLGAAGLKTRQAAPHEARQPAAPVEPTAAVETLPPLGRETAADIWPSAAPARRAAQEAAPAILADASPPDVASTPPLLATPQPAATSEPAPTDAPVVNEPVTTDAQAAGATEPETPPLQPPAAVQAEGDGPSPHWLLFVIAAALAISGIVVPFTIAAARRRIRVSTDAFASSVAARERVPPRFDAAIAARRAGRSAEDEETLREIMRARQRRAA